MVFTSFTSDIYGAEEDLVNVSVDDPYGVMPAVVGVGGLVNNSTINAAIYTKADYLVGCPSSGGVLLKNDYYDSAFRYSMDAGLIYTYSLVLPPVSSLYHLGLDDDGYHNYYLREAKVGYSYKYALNGYMTLNFWDYSYNKDYSDFSMFFEPLENFGAAARLAGIPQSYSCYAIYLVEVPAKYTIVYNGNGATSGSTGNSSHTYDVAQNLTANGYSRTGYTFTGWNTASDGSGTGYSNGQSVNNLTTTDGTTINLYAQWSLNSYTVSFDSCGGSAVSAKSVTYGSTYGSLPTPSRTGYTFNGWYTAPSGGTNVTSSSSVSITSNQTLYAQWSVNSYTVTVAPNGGTWGNTTSNSTVTQNYGTSVYIANPIRTGYSFNGWTNSGSGSLSGTTYTFGAGNGTLTANWKANNYTVTFNANGGTTPTASKSVTYASSYSTLPTPTRTGYTFQGWYTATSGGTKITSSSTVSTAGNHTLYAQWKINSYDVVYNANGGSTSATTVKVNYNSAINLKPVAEKEGYTFVGWGTSKNDKVPLSSLKMGVNNVTLYALYTIDVSDVANHNYPSYNKVKNEEVYLQVRNSSNSIKNYPLLFSSDVANTRMAYNYILNSTNISSFVGSSAFDYYIIAHDNAGNSRTIFKGSSDGDPNPPEPVIPVEYQQTVNHYKYIKYLDIWEHFDTVSTKVLKGNTYTPQHVTPPSGYVKGDIDGAYTVSGDKVSRAYYDPSKYILTFDSQGGTCEMTSKEVIYSDIYGYLPIPSKTGYYFDGWNTKKNGSGTKISSSDIYLIAGNSTVFAQWIPYTYRISLDSQGATNIGTAEYFEKYGVGNYSDSNCNTGIASITVPTKTGYKFLGYYTGKEGKGTQYIEVSGNILSKSTPKYTDFTSDTMLYADWSVNSYTIRYNANGGEGTMEDTIVDYDTPVTLNTNAFTKDGHTFKGWSTIQNDNNVMYNDKDSVKNLSSVDGDIVNLYAVWGVNNYNVRYDYSENGGIDISVSDNIVSTTYGTPINLGLTSTKPNWNFLGWNVDSKSTEVFNENSVWLCEKCGKEHSAKSMPSHDITLYAIYNKDIVLTFKDVDGTTLRERQVNKVIYNDEKFATLDILKQGSKDGWSSLGWSLDYIPNAEINYSPGSSVDAVENMTLYGCYTKDVTVSFDTNGSGVILDDLVDQAYYNAYDSLLNPVFKLYPSHERDNHSFDKWVDLSTDTEYDADQEVEFGDDILLTAKWNQYPKIEAYDRYFTLSDAQSGLITEDVLLESATATDLEDGELQKGTGLTIPNYSSMDYTSMTGDSSVSIKYKAVDSFGNIVYRDVNVHVVDSTPKEPVVDTYVRYISDEYVADEEGNSVGFDEGGLEEKSLWRTNPEYAITLDTAVNNNKVNIEKAEFNLLGLEYSVEKPGTGEWENLEASWKFTREDVAKTKEYIKDNGYGKYGGESGLLGFMSLFGNCINE